MKTLAFIKKEILNWFFLTLPVIYMLAVKSRLPEFHPFPLSWEQSIYYTIFFMLGLAFAVYLMLLIKPGIVPRSALHDHPQSLSIIKTLIFSYISLCSLIFISQAIGIKFNWGKIAYLVPMVFLMTFGNLYPTLRQNFIIGIKNAWTLSNELIWKKTHRFAGKLVFWAGIAGALVGILFNIETIPYMPVILVAYVFLLTFIPKVYSYMLFRRMQHP